MSSPAETHRPSWTLAWSRWEGGAPREARGGRCVAGPPQIKATKEAQERGRKEKIGNGESERRETESNNKDTGKQEGESERRVEREPQVSGQRGKANPPRACVFSQACDRVRVILWLGGPGPVTRAGSSTPITYGVQARGMSEAELGSYEQTTHSGF